MTLGVAAELTYWLWLLRSDDPPPAADNVVIYPFVEALIFSEAKAACEPRKKLVVLCWVCKWSRLSKAHGGGGENRSMIEAKGEWV